MAFLKGVNREIIEPYLLVSHKGPLVDEVRKLNIPVIVYPIYHWVAFGQFAKKNYFQRALKVFYGLNKRAADIGSVITKNEIDLVYSNTVTFVEGALAARKTIRPHIWHLREHVAGNKDLKAVLPASVISRIIKALSDIIILNSRSLKQGYAFNSNDNKEIIVYNGIDTNSFRVDHDQKNHFRKELGLTEATKVVSLIGSITPRKGLNTYIEMASKLAPKFDEIAFIIAGNGETKLTSELKNKVNQLGLNDKFHFLGWRNDIDKILIDTDLLIVSAEQEPFGRTVVEAMALGVPVVSTCCGGPEEIIVDGATGFLAPINDAEQLAKSASKVLSDPALASSFSEKGLTRVQEMFSEDVYVKSIESIITKLTNQYDCKKREHHAKEP